MDGKVLTFTRSFILLKNSLIKKNINLNLKIKLIKKNKRKCKKKNYKLKIIKKL